MSTNTVGSVEEGIAFYRQMLLIRRFEDAIQSLFQRGEVQGTTHLYSGQEAVAVGVAAAITPADVAAGTYRGHGHALALGVDPQGLLDEMLGRASGVCGGRGGSMNIIDRSHGLLGCFGIIGGSIATATGAAIAAKRTGDVAVAFFGDGTVNQGYFAECLNLAMVRKLPVVYICENNLYGEFTPWEQVTAGQIRSRPEALGMRAETIDGNDVWAVRAAVHTAAEHARSGNGPAFVEALTYRFVGHSRSDPGRYRKPGELDAWKLRDPLIIAAKRLSAEFGVADDVLAQVQREVEQQMSTVVEQGLAAPLPHPADAGTEFKEMAHA